MFTNVSKAWKWLMLMIVGLAIAVPCTSCGDDDEPDDSSIYGTWVMNWREGIQFTITMKRDGSGTLVAKPGGETLREKFDFELFEEDEDTYAIFIHTGGDRLFAMMEGRDMSEYIYEYKLRGNTLKVEGVGTFKRKS